MTSQLILFDQPRSGSHLLERMLTKQDDLKLLWNPFGGTRSIQVTWLRKTDYADGMPEPTRSEYVEGMDKGIVRWRETLALAQRSGHKLMVHTHPFFPIMPERLIESVRLISEQHAPLLRRENITMIPTDLLLRPGTCPIFSIRDPRLAVPSAYRTMAKMNLPRGGERANYLITTSNIYSRMLYDFFVLHGMQPLVLDADDYMTSEEFVRHVCVKAGLDPAQAYFSWPAATKEELDTMHPMYYASQSTLVNSFGVNPGLAAKNTDLSAEAAKWETEFGEDVALVKEVVALGMPHYEYLYERRLKIEV